MLPLLARASAITAGIARPQCVAPAFTSGSARPGPSAAFSLRHASPVASIVPANDDDDESDAADFDIDFQRQRLNRLAGFTSYESDEEESEEARVWAVEMGILSARSIMAVVAEEKVRLERELTNIVKMRNLYDLVFGGLFAAFFLLLQMKAHSEGWGIYS